MWLTIPSLVPLSRAGGGCPPGRTARSGAAGDPRQSPRPHPSRRSGRSVRTLPRVIASLLQPAFFEGRHITVVTGTKGGHTPGTTIAYGWRASGRAQRDAHGRRGPGGVLPASDGAGGEVVRVDSPSQSRSLPARAHFFYTPLYDRYRPTTSLSAPRRRTRMTSVKARKRYPRPRVPGGRDLGHGASFAHRGYNIPR